MIVRFQYVNVKFHVNLICIFVLLYKICILYLAIMDKKSVCCDGFCTVPERRELNNTELYLQSYIYILNLFIDIHAIMFYLRLLCIDLITIRLRNQMFIICTSFVHWNSCVVLRTRNFKECHKYINTYVYFILFIVNYYIYWLLCGSCYLYTIILFFFIFILYCLSKV